MNSSIPCRIAFALLASGLLIRSASAQSFALVNKEANFVQTGPATATPAPTGPFEFAAMIEGTATNPPPPVTITVPNNGGTRALAFDSGDGQWSFSQAFATQAALTAAYPNGTYVLNFGGRNVNVALNGDLFPAAPVGTFSAGTFVNGTLTIDRTQPLTVTINFPTNFVAGQSRLGISVDNFSGATPVTIEVSNEGTGFTTNTLTYTIPANTFGAGGSYQLLLEANRLVTLDQASTPGYRVVGAYSATTRVPIAIAGPPTIAAQPAGTTVAAGSTAVLRVVSPTATSYQWRRDGVPLAGQTNSTLVLTGASTVQGNYSVVASNSSGSVTSGNAFLGVQSTPNFGRLINLSILSSIRSSGDSFTLGYVVGGTGTTGAKPLVIRAVGPSLGALGVPGTVADPRLELFAGAAKTGENDNWGGLTTTASAMAAVGAFPFTGPTTLDAAVSADITTRDNSVKVAATGSGTGTVIAEIYDATPNASITATTPRLLNVSVLKVIDPGTTLTAGFVIRGNTSRTILVRAIGPGLQAAFGIPDAMPDPQLTLNGSGGVRVAQNDNWGGDAAIVQTGASVGAFAIANASSRDAMILQTLPPGDYTAEVSGVGGIGGTVIVEVYEVP